MKAYCIFIVVSWISWTIFCIPRFDQQMKEKKETCWDMEISCTFYIWWGILWRMHTGITHRCLNIRKHKENK